MKKVFLVLATLVATVGANAADLEPEQKVAAEVIVRQVVEKNLLGSEEYAKSQTEMLSDMVKRTVKAPYTSVTITSFLCDHVLGGKDQCSIGILDATNDGTESLSELNVTIKNGKVESASLVNIAG